MMRKTPGKHCMNHRVFQHAIKYKSYNVGATLELELE